MLTARIIDSEGYVATHQHGSIAHQLGWPFPFWNQGRRGCGWHFSLKTTAPPGYKPRENDPRASYSGIQFMDFATPISEPVVKHFISRHRLQKKDPSAAMSDPVEPIVYYVDRGAPEPVRSALIEGASWWNQAFEAVGYRNAFRVQN